MPILSTPMPNAIGTPNNPSERTALKGNDPLDLIPEDQEIICACLNSLLTDSLIFKNNLLIAHWNVTGPSFGSLHQMFDEMTYVANFHIDNLAERIKTLEGTITAMSMAYSNQATISSLPEFRLSWQEYVSSIISDLEHLNERITSTGGIYDIIQSTDDQVTMTMLIEIAASYQKNSWKLKSYLDGTQDINLAS